MRIEPLTASDLGALARLALRSLDHDELTADLLRRRIFDDPEHDPRYALCVKRQGRLAGAAIGVARRQPEGLVGCVQLIATDPDDRRQGIASALLAELEARLAADGAVRIEVGAGLPIYLFPGVEVCYTAALCLFERRGYVRIRDTSNLAVDLAAGDFDTAAQEAALRERGVTIRRFEPADRDVLDFYLATRWSPVWQLEGLAALEATPPTGFLALKAGRVVGFAVYDVVRPGWFGPIGTDEELRGLGVGTVLLRRCLRDWQSAGRRRAEIAWTSALYFYSIAADARVCRTYWQMSKPLAPPAGLPPRP